jgi:uncharacterized protein
VIVWDETKREINLRKHGLDFRDASLVYDNLTKMTFSSPRAGEERLLDVAIVDVVGRFLTLLYVHRGEEIRVISFRPSSRAERRRYEQQKEPD